MKFREYLRNNIILFDGAMGTEIQKLTIKDDEWGGYAGCNEVLSINAPHHISGIHHAYLEAGANVIETNTFGANRIVLSEYGLEDKTRMLNSASAVIAAKARDSFNAAKLSEHQRFVAGSMGPGTRLPSLGQIDFDTLHFSYLEQARGMIEGGVDLFIIETCQDLLQVKAAVIAVHDAMRETGLDLPVIVSVTVETNGTMLVGSDIPTVVTAINPLGVDIIGLNCATGPAEMRPHIEELSTCFGGTLFCMPNAGFPVQRDGRLIYDLPPGDFADILTAFVSDFGVEIIGGCCGSDPGFIKELRGRIPSLVKRHRDYSAQRGLTVPALSSLYSVQELRQKPAPFFVGERINSNGSKKFRGHLLEEDWDAIISMGKEQLKTGAHSLDICAAYAGRDEGSDMRSIIAKMVTSVDLPVVIDSTDPEVVEAALKLIGGRALINSVNLENGKEHAGRLLSLAGRYGAAIIALTIDETGMARDIDRKLAIARRILSLATDTCGLSPSDLIIDPLTFTLGSGDGELRDAGWHTLNALTRIKKEMPGVHTVLGVSNISFGLNPHSREVLNSVFLSEAIHAGLDLAIVNVHKIIPTFQLSVREKQLALHLIYNRGQTDPLLSYIDYFDRNSAREANHTSKKHSSDPPSARVRSLVLEGTKSGLTDVLDRMMKSFAPPVIIAEHLIPTMKEVGELFGEGSLQLPFVLQSAEVMRMAVDYLEPYLEKHENGPGKKVVLATVRGDVHDIGKNLVDIILSNNGYQVFNLGIKVDIETIIEKALEIGADAIGMSGLLVKSTSVMKSNLEEMRRRNIHIPVLLGGAALTKQFVVRDCDPLLNAPVHYCRDAFDALRALEGIAPAAETVPQSAASGASAASAASAAVGPSAAEPAGPASPKSAVSQAAAPHVEVPQAAVPQTAVPQAETRSPGTGKNDLLPEQIAEPQSFELITLRDIDPPDLFRFINRGRLFRSRWKYRRGAASEADYTRLEKDEIIPLFNELAERLKTAPYLQPQSALRFFPCRSGGDEVLLFDPENRREIARFEFTRQRKAPFRSVPDFFLPESSPRFDIIGLQIVTLGADIAKTIQKLFREDKYREYLHMHGLAVELTESLAEYTHSYMEKLLGLEKEIKPEQAHIGTRYSFGYPCCPDLSANRTIGTLLQADQLGITFSEDDQMVPEFSTSAFICFNPRAEYV